MQTPRLECSEQINQLISIEIQAPFPKTSSDIISANLLQKSAVELLLPLLPDWETGAPDDTPVANPPA